MSLSLLIRCANLVRNDKSSRNCSMKVLFLVTILYSASPAAAWNIPGHMLNGAIAYQILQRENPSTIPIVRSVLEKKPWYETRWKAQLEKLPDTERDEMIFMLAARWADDIHTLDKSESRLPWHYVDFPFNQKASQQTSRLCSRPKRISSQP